MINDFKPDIAIIMRDDDIINKYKLKRVTIDTSFGPVDRCYIGTIYNVNVLIIYGRFNGQKVPSGDINHQQTIEAVKNSGATKLIGTFVVGGINKKMPQGSVYIINDFVGYGNYNIHWNQSTPFRNAEVFEPFCKELKEQLCSAARKMPFKVKEDAIYLSFCGYPRIETKAELEFYEKQGFDIVGQTCDPEATCARLYKLCYAGIAVQIDDPTGRKEYIDSVKKKENKSPYVEDIRSCRKRTSQIVLQFLKDYKNYECNVCSKISRCNNNFREFPDYYYE